jgi:hypothetical protein
VKERSFLLHSGMWRCCATSFQLQRRAFLPTPLVLRSVLPQGRCAVRTPNPLSHLRAPPSAVHTSKGVSCRVRRCSSGAAASKGPSPWACRTLAIQRVVFPPPGDTHLVFGRAGAHLTPPGGPAKQPASYPERFCLTATGQRHPRACEHALCRAPSLSFPYDFFHRSFECRPHHPIIIGKAREERCASERGSCTSLPLEF